MKITAAIISLNEEENIGAAIESVAWVDEILVVDSGSTDKTVAIAEQNRARVISHPWPGFALQKQFAVDNATHEWILSIDADERVTPELRRSIEALKSCSTDQPFDGYRIARRSFYMGRWIKGGGWYPDHQLRFFNRNKGRWVGEYIHESFKLDRPARTGTLTGDLLHYSVKDALHHHRMIGERYAPLGARQMLENGRRTGPLKLALVGPCAFIKSYLLQGGFRDGVAGLCIASFSAHHAFLKNLLLWELMKSKDVRKS